ncbi:class A beta-lactamase [Nonomuraea sp. KC401]|uniref:class A beta-lactamase n=1 Tax=unclassified Nonomuraea TaxID=2593643 RepID=UPI0010FD58A2|nr:MULTISPECIES: class A beta-lactamase [unclassified Nonomuraea]NBE95828.1 class A beta-lactamase [Nonomuraea sp. K271]TLF71968.1 class A beta-lactamase [Nonomuraea sp. KC401]
MRHARTRTIASALAASLLVGGATTPAAQAAVPHAGQVKKDLRSLEVSFKGRIGAYALDTATGKTVTYRAGERFPMLSTFKAPLCAAVLRKARTSKPGLMNRLIRWTAADMKPNSPVTEKHVKDGLTVSQLCEAAVTMSDGTASNLLLKQVGGPKGLTRYFRTLKDATSRMDRWHPELNDWTPKDKRDTTTPAAIGRDLRVLTVGRALHAKDRRQLLAWLLANKTGGERIRAGLPKSWTVADKTGTNSDGFGGGNDIAVVWPKKGAAPVIMSIYTNRTKGLPTDNKTIAKTATILARALGKL